MAGASHQNKMLSKIIGRVFRKFNDTKKPSLECKICLGSLPSTSFHRGRICKDGGHEESDRVCFKCLTIHVRTQMANERWDSLGCPFCQSHLRFRVVKAYAEPCLTYQYKAFLYSYGREWRENFQWCLNPDCHYGQIHNVKLLGIIMYCRACASPTCAFHRMPAHHYKGQNCEEFGADVNPFHLSGAALTTYQRNASERMIHEDSKRCPRCGVFIEKNCGCDSVRCSRCKLHFSWRRVEPGW